MQLKKRGAVEVQFNWIFILIAGAVILLFFGTIIMKQRAAAEQKMAASLLVDLESIMTGSMVSPQTSNLIPIPNKEINFQGCDFYYIGKKNEASDKLKKDIKDKIVFAPGTIKGTRLVAWTLPWDAPYRVTNFLYLTSPQIRYIIVYNSASEDFADEIESLLPNKTTIIDGEESTVMFREKMLAQSNFEFEDMNHYKIKFVFLDVDPVTAVDLNAFSGMKDEDVRAVKIETNQNKIIFYMKDKINNQKFMKVGPSEQESASYYLDNAMVIGAIFAEDKDMYECAMQNAFKRLGVVTEVYIRRTESIQDNPQLSEDCQANYGDELTSGTPLYKLRQILDASTEFNQVNINKIKSAGASLESQDKNCPLVY